MLNESDRICEYCGGTYSKPSNLSWPRWRERRFCSRRCGSEVSAIERFGSVLPLCECGCGRRVTSRRNRWIGEHKPDWRGVTRDGYIRLWRPGHPLAHRNGTVLEHRYVLHEAGVEVPSNRVVHHINEDRSDNRVENLEVLPLGEHSRRHAIARGHVRNQYGTWPVRATC